MKQYYVYIIANKSNSVLYVGVTNNISRRIYEHKTKKYPKSFSARYNVHKLIYYEIHYNAYFAIIREKQLKKWQRMWKLELVMKTNRKLRDLSDKFGNLRDLY